MASERISIEGCYVRYWFDMSDSDGSVQFDLEDCEFLLAHLPGITKTLRENTTQAKIRRTHELRAEVEQKLKEINAIEHELEQQNNPCPTVS